MDWQKGLFVSAFLLSVFHPNIRKSPVADKSLAYSKKMKGGEIMPSAQVLESKKKIVADLTEKMKNAKLILLTDYRGINVTDVTNLRRKLKAVNGEYLVIKNNITKRALAECKIEGLDEFLNGPTAVIIGNEDYLEPSKIIYEYSKDNDFYKIKSGVIDGKVSSKEEIETLAKLPSREVLIAKLAGSLLGNITKLAIAINAVKSKKEEV